MQANMCACARAHMPVPLQSPENNLKYCSSDTIHIGLDSLIGVELTMQARLAG